MHTLHWPIGLAASAAGGVDVGDVGLTVVAVVAFFGSGLIHISHASRVAL